jgi:hypothetical protein
MSDNTSSNSQSASDSQSNSDNQSSSSAKDLQSGDIKKPSSRLRHIDPVDTRSLCLEGYPQKTTDQYRMPHD